MTILGLRLSDVPEALDWYGLRNFTRHIPQTSALWAELHPEEAYFCSPLHQAAMLADLIDAVRFSHVTKEAARQMKRYARPKSFGTDANTHRYGKGGIPAKDFKRWWEAHAHGK